MPVMVAEGGEEVRTGDRSIDRRDRTISRNNRLAPRRSLLVGLALIALRPTGAILLCALASQSSFAQQRPAASLDRPDPRIGDGFAAAMGAEFKTTFGVNDAEAKCLVYEVMTEVRTTGKYDGTPVDVASKVASRCAVVLKPPR